VIRVFVFKPAFYSFKLYSFNKHYTVTTENIPFLALPAFHSPKNQIYFRSAILNVYNISRLHFNHFHLEKYPNELLKIFFYHDKVRNFCKCSCFWYLVFWFFFSFFCFYFFWPNRLSEYHSRNNNIVIRELWKFY